MGEKMAVFVPGVGKISVTPNVRTLRQYLEYIKDQLSGVCPFCKLDLEKNIMVASNDVWTAWKNPYPLNNTDLHLVMAPREHLTHIRDLMTEDWLAFGELLETISILFSNQMPGGGLIMRFGDQEFHAGSIKHLHANLIVPNLRGEVRIPLAKDPEEIEEKRKIIEVFEKIRSGTKPEDLSLKEFELVKDRLK